MPGLWPGWQLGHSILTGGISGQSCSWPAGPSHYNLRRLTSPNFGYPSFNYDPSNESRYPESSKDLSVCLSALPGASHSQHILPNRILKEEFGSLPGSTPIWLHKRQNISPSHPISACSPHPWNQFTIKPCHSISRRDWVPNLQLSAGSKPEGDRLSSLQASSILLYAPCKR